MNGEKTGAVWDNSGNIIAEYGANEVVYSRGLNGEIITDGENNYTYNGHVDTVNLTRRFGTDLAFTAVYDYDAFGNLADNGTVYEDTPFKYNGQYTDEETGFIY